MDRIKGINEIKSLVNRIKGNGKIIVTTIGSFDILH